MLSKMSPSHCNCQITMSNVPLSMFKCHHHVWAYSQWSSWLHDSVPPSACVGTYVGCGDTEEKGMRWLHSSIWLIVIIYKLSFISVASCDFSLPFSGKFLLYFLHQIFCIFNSNITIREMLELQNPFLNSFG